MWLLLECWNVFWVDMIFLCHICHTQCLYLYGLRSVPPWPMYWIQDLLLYRMNFTSYSIDFAMILESQNYHLFLLDSVASLCSSYQCSVCWLNHLNRTWVDFFNYLIPYCFPCLLFWFPAIEIGMSSFLPCRINHTWF